MKTLLTIVFCKIYGFIKDEFNAMGLLTILLSVNIFTIIGYYKALVQHTSHILIPKFYEIMIVVVVGILNYSFFLTGKKYRIFYEDFRQNPSLSGRRGSWITALYVVSTFAFLAGLVWAGRMNLSK